VTAKAQAIYDLLQMVLDDLADELVAANDRVSIDLKISTTPITTSRASTTAFRGLSTADRYSVDYDDSAPVIHRRRPSRDILTERPKRLAGKSFNCASS